MRHLIDLTGMTFGRLTVIGHGRLFRYTDRNHKGTRRFWKCRCQCGKIVEAVGSNLKRTTKSCGCLRRENNRKRAAKIDVGRRFGRLTVVGRHGSSVLGRSLWDCICDCGGKSTVAGRSLIHGHSKSCGSNACRTKFESAANKLLSAYRCCMTARKLGFSLSESEFFELTTLACEYCGCLPFRTIRSNNRFSSYTYNGLDRVDNLSGYHRGNVVPCCYDCNRAKTDRSVSEFFEWIDRVHSHQRLKETKLWEAT